MPIRLLDFESAPAPRRLDLISSRPLSAPAPLREDDDVLAAALGRGAVARVSFAVLRAIGWRVVIAQPVPMKCVVVFYPHTSNWEFPIGILAKWASGIPFRYVGKDALFRWPFGRLFRRWGGIPVDRQHTHRLHRPDARRIRAPRRLSAVFAPEGTRSRTEHWRSGFYHLARAARVPVGLCFVDYPTRRIGVGAFVDLTGDPVADMRTIAAFYADKHGYRPEKQGPVVLRDEPAPTP